MKKIEIRLGQNSYSIEIGSGILSQTGLKLKALDLSDKSVIITNPVVQKLHGAVLKQSLIAAGFKTIILEVPDGEEYKSLESAVGGRRRNGRTAAARPRQSVHARLRGPCGALPPGSPLPYFFVRRTISAPTLFAIQSVRRW